MTEITITVNTDPFLLFFGSFFVILGFSVFFAKKAWEDFLDIFSKYSAVPLIIGFMALPISLFIIFFYSDWSTMASTILMAIGYLVFVKSVVFMVFPAFVQGLVDKDAIIKPFWLRGVIAIVLGTALLFA